MRRRRLVACMTQVHRARDRGRTARSGGRTEPGRGEAFHGFGGTAGLFSQRYVPFRIHAGSRVMLQKDYAREAWPCEDQLRSGFVEFSGVVVLFVGFMFAGVGESGEKMERR